MDSNVTEPLREHDPDHPFLRQMIGCGHGRLWEEVCPECEIVGLMLEYEHAARTIQRVRNRLRKLGAPLPGEVAP